MAARAVRPIRLRPRERARCLTLLRQGLEGYAEILFAYLLGSFLEGEEFNDLDVAVCATSVPPEAAFDYEGRLEWELGGLVRLPVDVRLLNYAPLAFCYHATRGELLLCRDDGAQVDFAARTWSLYGDFAISGRRLLREMLLGSR